MARRLEGQHLVLLDGGEDGEYPWIMVGDEAVRELVAPYYAEDSYQDPYIVGTMEEKNNAILNPLSYHMFYNAELGLLDPTKPPGPDNPRLKDSLDLFYSCVSGPWLVRLAGIFVAIATIREGNWDLLDRYLWKRLFSRGSLKEELSLTRNYRAHSDGSRCLRDLFAETTPFGGSADEPSALLLRALFLSSNITLEEAQAFLEPLSPKNSDDRSKIEQAYDKYADAYEAGDNIHLEDGSIFPLS